MFKRSNKKKESTKDRSILKLIKIPKITELIQPCLSSSEPISLTDDCLQALVDYLRLMTNDFDIKLAYLKEVNTTINRQLQLDDTKDIVYSLRETDQTSGGAMDYLREKLDILIEEREDLALDFLTFRETFDSIAPIDIPSKVQAFVASIVFLETDSWEEQLDYYRTRFLLQKTQDADQALKDDFIPDEEKSRGPSRDPLAKIKIQPEIPLSKQTYEISFLKKQNQELVSLVKTFNQLMIEAPEDFPYELLELSETTLQEKLVEQKEKSLVVGKELYALKREQGILTLKTYEIIQTLRSRLFNISGSIANRIFLTVGFKEMIAAANDVSLTDEARKVTIDKMITRFLRILGAIKPGA
ncbi:MAG: hypothetical protein ACTSSH_08115 [Candidatus Heimdallarchaeota archaeon]